LFEMLERRWVLAADGTGATAFLVTDQLDYPPGTTANITGGNFQVGETIHLTIARTDGVSIVPPGVTDWEVTDGSEHDLDGSLDGNIATTWEVDQQFAGASLQLVAVGESSGISAQTEFTDGVSTPNMAAASDTGFSSSDNYTSDSTPTFSGTITELLTLSTTTADIFYSIDGGSFILAQTVPISAEDTANYSFITGVVGSGTHTITVRAVWDPGIGPTPDLIYTSAALNFTIDTSAPANLDLINDSGASSSDNYTNDFTPSFTVSDPDLGNSVANSQIFLLTGTPSSTGGTQRGSDTAATTSVWDLPSSSIASDGTYTFFARDLAGNFSSGLIVTIDRSAPTGFDLVAASDRGVNSSDNYTNDFAPSFTVFDTDLGNGAGNSLILLQTGTPSSTGGMSCLANFGQSSC
jgi:large repetitive protein